MLYLFVDLRYHRQLNKICPDVPIRLFSAIGDSVRKNGGTANRIGCGMLYNFEETSIGFAFSASRVIDELRGLLDELRERIREYYILVDATEERMNPDAFKERLYQYRSIITPDEGILFTANALEFLRPYVSTVPLKGTGLELYSGPRIIEYAVYKQDPADQYVLSVYANSGTDIIKILWDMLSRAPETDVQTFLTDEALVAFEENKPALNAYSWFRFSTEHPDYLREAVLDFFKQKILARTKILGEPIPVTIIGTGAFGEEISYLKETLSELCSFSAPIKPSFLPGDAASMPSDLLDMAYLTYRMMHFLYYQEIVSFFQFLDKDASFIVSLGSWLYSYGILSDPTDFRSVNLSMEEEIAILCGASKSANDRKIADFLWLKYELGFLMPTMDLLIVFNELGFPLSNSFLVSCFFYSDNQEGKKICLDSISSPHVRSAVEKLASAEKSFAFGEYTSAETHTRDVLHFFQKEKIAYGEFRAFCLLSQLSLVKNKGSDSIAYLDYALENAEQIRNEFSVLDTRIKLASVHFGVGSFDFSLSSVENAEKNAHTCFAKDKQLKILFIKGRIYLELGDYLNAGASFQAATSLATIYGFSDIMLLSRIWYARVLSHEGKYHAAVRILGEYQDRIPDAACFRIEAAVLSGHQVSDLIFPELIDPDGNVVLSGFSTMEDRFITSGSDDYTAPSLFQAFSLYHRARFEGEDSVLECFSGIEALAKTSYARNDAYGTLYYYLCFELARYLPLVSQSDGTGFLSRGFKYLQKRAKQIDNNSMREQFLRNPVWNSRIFRAARENMLI
ncbi:MAG TPA: hypothetical protein GXZ47_01575 [Treponema sp.]|nr:hypothetical protein [Treponema sp.]